MKVEHLRDEALDIHKSTSNGTNNDRRRDSCKLTCGYAGTQYGSTLLSREASLGASLRELAAVVKLQCTAAVHRFLRARQLNTSAVMQSKVRMHRIYSLLACIYMYNGFTCISYRAGAGCIMRISTGFNRQGL